MKSGRVTKRLNLLLPVILSIGLMGNEMICHGNKPSGAPPNGNLNFDVEYDYMQGYDVFSSGEAYASNVFSQCATSLLLFYDEADLSVTQVQWANLPSYMESHAQKWPDGSLMYGVQLLGMSDALNKPSGVLTIAGVTFLPDAYYSAYQSAIFVQAIQNLGANIQSMKEKTVIHELGHARGLLHSCEKNSSGWVQLPGHDAPGCVMCLGRIDSCSTPVVDVTVNPFFCPADCERLKKVK